jgi:hypothetical protein
MDVASSLMCVLIFVWPGSDSGYSAQEKSVNLKTVTPFGISTTDPVS